MIMQSSTTDSIMQDLSGIAMLVGLVLVLIVGICALGSYVAHRRTGSGFMTDEDYMAELLGRPQDAAPEADTVIRNLSGQPAE